MRNTSWRGTIIRIRHVAVFLEKKREKERERERKQLRGRVRGKGAPPGEFEEPPKKRAPRSFA